MSITALQSPQTVSFSKNPIIYQLQTDNYATTAGVKHRSFFTGIGAGSDTLKLEWGDESVEFTFGVPDNSGTVIKAYEGEGTSAWTGAYLLKALKANVKLFNEFNITSSTTYIYLEARETGAEYNLTITHTGLDSFTTGVEYEGVDLVVRENFRIVLELYVDDVKIITLQLEPDENNKVEFDVQDYIDKKLSVDVPDIYSTDFQLAPNCIKPFFVRYYEKYGDPVQDYVATTSTTVYAINGGMKKEDWPVLGTAVAGGLYTRFLSLHPTEKKINRTQKEYLYYHCRTLISSLSATMYFSDGTQTTADVLTPSSSTTNAVYIIPTGFADLGLASFETADKTIVYYTVHIRYILSVFPPTYGTTSSRTYVMDDLTYAQERYFLYQTSLGGCDTIRVLEEADMTMKVNFDTSEKILPNGYSAQTGQREKINISYEEEFTVSQGLLEKDLKLSMQDFLISKHHYEILSNKFISIELQNKEDLVFSEAEDLHPFTIQYKRNYTNRAFSK